MLSIGSAAMLPATVALWLGLEIAGFAMLYDAGLAHHSFDINQPLAPGIGSAFYLSAGAISSLAFGDIIARSGLFQALLDLETIIGLATFTLALGYVVATFGVLQDLDSLHSTVRRHAEDPGKPSSILARHFRVASRPSSPTSQYTTTLTRLQRSFVGPCPLEAPQPIQPGSFSAAYRDRVGDRQCVAFRALQDRARAAAGLPPPPDPDLDLSYCRYRDWLGFAYRRELVLSRIAGRLATSCARPRPVSRIPAPARRRPDRLPEF